MDATYFSGRLKSLRESAGLTQSELARLSGVLVATISRLEGVGGNPLWDTVQRLTLALNVSSEEFRDPAIVLPKPGKPVVRGRPKGKRKRKWSEK